MNCNNLSTLRRIGIHLISNQSRLTNTVQEYLKNDNFIKSSIIRCIDLFHYIYLIPNNILPRDVSTYSKIWKIVYHWSVSHFITWGVRCDKDDTHCGLKYFNCIISRKDEDLEYIISLPHLKDRGGECNLNKSAPLCIILPESKMRI